MTTITAPTVEVVSDIDGYSAYLNVNGHVVKVETWWNDDYIDAIIAWDVHLDAATMTAAARTFVEGPFATQWAADTRDPVYGGPLLPDVDTTWAKATVYRCWGHWVESDHIPVGDDEGGHRWEELDAPVDGAEMYTEIRFRW